MIPRKTLFIRLNADKHDRVRTYASMHDLAITDVVEGLVDQLLAQVDPTFEVPEYLRDHYAKRAEVQG